MGANRRVRRALVRARTLWYHPHRQTRWTLRILAGGLLAGALSLPWTRAGLVATLALVDIGLIGCAAYWGVTRARQLREAWALALRWSLGLAILGTLTTSSLILRQLASQLDLTIPLSFSLSLAVLLLFPLFLLICMAFSAFGAALCAFVARRSPDPERRRQAALEGVPCIWLSLLIAGVIATLLEDRAPVHLSLLPVLAAPLVTLYCLALLQRFDLQEIASNILRLLGDRLIWRRQRNGRTRTTDFRGTALGGIAALLVVLAGQLGAFTGLQADTLAFLMQVSNATVRFADLLAEGDAPPESSTVQRILESRERIVLLRMDNATLHRALTTGSEAAVQAEILQKLRAFRPMAIVLPAPLLPGQRIPRTPAAVPAITPETLVRTQRDLPRLVHAVRAAGNALIYASQNAEHAQEQTAATPSSAPTEAPVPDPLRDAAYLFCEDGLGNYSSGHLPVLHLSPHASRPTLPVALFALDRSCSPRIAAQTPLEVTLCGQQIPLIGPHSLPVFFHYVEPGYDFKVASYSDVLRGQRLYAGRAQQNAGMAEQENLWQSPEQFFRGRIVFLDTLVPATRETPVGTMGRTELLAHATTMLLSGIYLIRAPFWGITLFTLLTGLLVGAACTRRSPLQATGRVGVALITIVVISTLSIVWAWWFDPIVPAFGTMAAFLLSTQFTYGLERAEQERNRTLLQRLVAPELVEELLEDPEGKLGLHGRRQNICVLFADVRGFTPFAEANTPETVVEVINAYLAPMTRALLNKGGILDKYTGDGLMALFRVTRTPRESARMAIEAALEMQHRAAEISRRLQEQGRTPLRMGIGIHYGDAVVGLIGNPPHQMNYTALGVTVVVSQRLQALADGGEIVVSETVFEILREDPGQGFHLLPGEPVTIKGLTRPVRPYRVVPDTDAHPDSPTPAGTGT
ncbi:MAG: adenylate/guanylate cyclase domain-containing protein [Chloroherpetonaceae bacterium]|nr:CHASE2 domain-containing protein [Chthonomonadaceae bacterium]MDW8207082.1 adenylate/guanylate cyclase domain-containing protein [Chloroherpetonaceae bacterium]